MKAPDLRSVDPRTLHVPPSRLSEAGPAKLQRQLARFGSSTTGMPIIANGVTRVTRIAKYLPGTPVTVEVIGK